MKVTLDPLQEVGDAVVRATTAQARLVESLAEPAGSVRPGQEVLLELGHVGRAGGRCDDMKAQVQGRHCSGGGQHRSVLDVESLGPEVDRGEPLHEGVGERPVRGGRPPIKEAGVREREDARVGRHDPRPLGRGDLQRSTQVRVAVQRHVDGGSEEDEIGIGDAIESLVRRDAPGAEQVHPRVRRRGRELDRELRQVSPRATRGAEALPDGGGLECSRRLLENDDHRGRTSRTGAAEYGVGRALRDAVDHCSPDHYLELVCHSVSVCARIELQQRDQLERSGLVSTQSASAYLGARRLVVLLGEWEGGGSVYRELADRIRLLVLDGRLPLGIRLPSERDLASALARSRSTVVAAYDLLRADGFAESRQGSGTTVCLPRRPVAAEVIDFAHAVPPPIEGLGDLMRHALGHVDRAVAGPGFDMYGDEILRARIADRYAQQGVPTDVGQVLVTIGGQHAIGLMARLMVRAGDRVLAESPAYPHAYEAFEDVGGQVISTPVGRDGWDGDHLLAELERSRPVLAYLMPDFQNPTGASMPPELRREVARSASRSGTCLVIDETTADLDIDRPWHDGPFARYAADTGAAIVSVGSLSKSMWGGMRIGWIRAETEIIDRIARIRPSFDLGTPRLEQLVACELLPQMPELLRLRREQLRLRRDHLKSELDQHLPTWDAPVPSGGLSFWIGLDEPVSSSLSLMCQDRGMALSAGPRFTVDGSQERFVRLPFTLAPSELTAGVNQLAQVWAALAGTGVRGARTFQSVV